MEGIILKAHFSEGMGDIIRADRFYGSTEATRSHKASQLKRKEIRAT
jgi:hypothetical protein